MPRFTLHLLGTFQARLDDKLITGFRSDKARALLAYLAVEAEYAHRRDSLAALFWPESSDSAARASLRMTLSNLRHILAPIATDDMLVLEADRQAVRCHRVHAQFWLDVAQFDDWLQTAESHPHQDIGRCLACLRRLSEAVALYQGDFLAGLSLADTPEFDEWRLVQQEKRHQQALTALQLLTKHFAELGDYQQAQSYARRQLALAPWHEAAHRQLMRVLALDGQRAAALAQYEACRQALAEELGVEPMAETAALAEQIKAGTSVDTNAINTPLPSTNLPPQITPFFGRTDLLAALRRLLLDPTYRLVVLVGLGGVGKTRLAIALGEQILVHYPHGVWFVPLAPVRPTVESSFTVADQVADAIIAASDMSYMSDDEPQAQVFTFFRAKQALLILDNFEHVTAATPFLLTLIEQCPQVRLLVTSRERLKLQSAYHVPLSGLDIAGNDDGPLSSSEALFAERARRSQPEFALSTANRETVRTICRLVGGLPLGIELAAAWVGHFTPTEIATALAEDVEFLAVEAIDLPARHRSLQAAFAHSWQLLDMAEARLLAQLTTFQGNFDRQAALAITGASLERLVALVNKSLVERTGSGAYQLHELVRQLAAARLLTMNGLATETAKAHCHYYCRLLATAESRLRGGAQVAAVTQIRNHWENIRAAWLWGTQAEEWQILDESLQSLWMFCDIQSRFGEATQLLTAALSQVTAHKETAVAERLWLRLTIRHAAIRIRKRQEAEAAEQLAHSREKVTAHGWAYEIALAEGLLGWAVSNLGDTAAAMAYSQQALARFRQLGCHWEAAACLMTMGAEHLAEADIKSAQPLLREAHTLLEEAENLYWAGRNIDNLTEMALQTGDLVRAHELTKRHIAICQQIHDQAGLVSAQLTLARVVAEQGNIEEAAVLRQAARALGEEIGYLPPDLESF